MIFWQLWHRLIDLFIIGFTAAKDKLQYPQFFTSHASGKNQLQRGHMR
tara:strand:+ start:2286 stop:2429 length:144 start_codon:yes stop_codon:yes gene_type:complete